MLVEKSKVIDINEKVGEKYDTDYGVLNEGVLESILQDCDNSIYDISKKIVNLHPFIDANKRTAFVLYFYLTSDKTINEVINDYEDVLKELA